jgi:3-(methylthio)propanoyl-CoA dehydrogenase
MANYFKDNEDLQFYFERGLDWGPLVEATERGFADEDGFSSTAEAIEFYREIAEMVGEFVAEEVGAHAAEIDREGVRFERGEASFPPRLEGIFRKVKELDLHGMCLPRELGGMNASTLLYHITSELFARGDVSVMAHQGFHGGIAMALLVFSIMEGTSEIDPKTGRIVSTRFQEIIEEIVRGDAWGCMDITEPDAGSDMAQLRTRGEQDEDGNWHVTGEKIFITSGHGKYHFVIARTEQAGDPDDPMAGLAGLSMFLVPTYEDLPDGSRRWLARIDRVEEKLGHHGSVTAAILFDRTPAHLIGRRGEGFKYMLTLMNNARLGVGFESIGLCEAAYRLARDYAAGRPSMGKTIDRHELIADYLDEMATDIQGLRALAMEGAVHEELSIKTQLRQRALGDRDELEARRLERERDHHKGRARRFTPLLKYLAAEKAVEAARRCVQIHGGNGYMKEYGAEKLLRDAVVMPIYEGTSQIQALMAMKDTLSSVFKNPQAFVKRIAQARWRALSARDPLERRLAKIQQISLSVQQHLITRTATDKVRSLQGMPLSEWPDAFRKNWDPKRDFAYALLHAERLTRILADEAIGEVLFEQAQRHPDRRELCERYLERAEPRCRFLAEEITNTGARLLASLHGDDASAAEDVG